MSFDCWSPKINFFLYLLDHKTFLFCLGDLQHEQYYQEETKNKNILSK